MPIIKNSKIYTKKNKISIVLILFFLFFGIIGSFALYFFLIRPIFHINAAKNWDKVPCVITKSQIIESSGEDQAVYKVDIHFKYNYNDKSYQGGQYNFNETSSSGYPEKNEIVLKYPIGLETICFVDPMNPAKAVLNRDYFNDLWFSLFILIFVVIGFGGAILSIYFTWKKNRLSAFESIHSIRENSHNYSDLNNSEEEAFFQNEKKIIGKRDWEGLWSSIMFAFFWNGVLYFAYRKGIEKDPMAFQFHNTIGAWAIIFLCLAGVMIFFIFLYYFYKLFNPIFVIELSDSKIRLGDKIKINVTCEGYVEPIGQLSISFIGVESVYSKGENGSAIKNEFYKENLLTLEKWEKSLYTTTFVIPENKMHSFKSKHNTIIWKILVKGKMKLRPNIYSEFVIKVAPL